MRQIAMLAVGVTLVTDQCPNASPVFLHELATPETRAFDSTLLGAWRPTRGVDTTGRRWVLLSQDGDSDYVLIITDPRGAAALTDTRIIGAWNGDSAALRTVRADPALTARYRSDSAVLARVTGDSGLHWAFLGRLVRLGSVSFMDFTTLGDLDSVPPPLGADLQLGVHAFWRLQVESSRLRLWPLDGPWLTTAIDSGRVTLAHDRVDDRAVVTAPSRELQTFLRRYAADTGAFRDTLRIELRRLEPRTP